MKSKIPLLSYAGMAGIPVLMILLLVAYALNVYDAIVILKILLAVTAIAYSAAGISEVFMHGKKA
ncbi:MAG: hypothetical protein ACREBH_02160 [Candidatus Micrarchaeaceae archaeon]